MQIQSQIVGRVAAKFAMRAVPKMEPRMKATTRRRSFADPALECISPGPCCCRPCPGRCGPIVPQPR